ncbi:D-Ala-D-Ala carboxypeptidase family metallohydrolase [Thermodesulfobacteriota bacterium]
MVELSMPLSKNFTIGEMLRSNSIERDENLKQEQYNPPPDIITNLQCLVETTLQPIRSRLRFPIRLNSGYRCPMLNKLVGGSATSQHCRGEAADCELSPRFLSDPVTATIRNEINSMVRDALGKSLRPDVNQNFYLFAYLCLHLDELDVDQVIHEYGEGFGHPAWIHIASSKRQDKRQILMVGQYTNRKYLKPSPDEALDYGTLQA